ncbi:MAG: DUF4153 domain-containing protein [Fibrobacter sp.]|nr:DUF4153 domain-containing protein [Fibrobacter sp.]
MDFTKIKQYPTQISNVFKRFPLPMGFGAFSALYSMFLVRTIDIQGFVHDHPKFFIWVITFSALSIFLTTTCKLMQEAKDISPKTGWIITGVSEAVLLALTAGYIANGDLDNLHFIAQSVVWSAIVVLSPLIVPFFKDKDDFPLWNFIGKSTKSFLTSTIITLLFYGAMAVLAVCASILQPPIHDELFFFDTGVICLCIVFPILYFASLPNLNEPNENSEVSRYFSNTIHLLFMPVLIVYIFFVYAYAIQVRDLGALGFMALAAVISTILICGILYPGHFKDNFDKAFLKSVPWVTIPLTFISAWGISDIFTDAGPNAHFVAFYIITALIWLLASLIILLIPRIKKKIWWTLASLIIVALISTFSPVNVFKISAHTYLTSEKRIEREVERLQEREKYEAEQAEKKTRTKIYEFDNDDYNPITIPANRRTVEKLYNTHLKYTQVSLAGDTIFIKVKPSRSDDDSTFMHFTVPVSLLSGKDNDKDNAEAIADAGTSDISDTTVASPTTTDAVSVKKEKPTHLVLDNGSETLVLTEAFFKFIEGEEDENYGSLHGYIFK